MSFTIRNITADPAVDIMLNDMGITLPAGGDRNLFDRLGLSRIYESAALAAAVADDEIIILDSAGDPLSKADSLVALSSKLILEENGGAGVVASRVLFTDMAGHGSTNTKIVHFTNYSAGDGVHLTGTHSATLGDSVKIKTKGIYAIFSIRDFSSADSWQGMSVNGVVATAVPNLAVAQILISTWGLGANVPRLLGAITKEFVVNDILRVHDAGNAKGSRSAEAQFSVVGPLSL